MTVLEEIAPFQWKTLGERKVEESPLITRLKRKKKNLLTNAKRRGSAELYQRCKKIEKDIRIRLQKRETNHVRNIILKGGNQGLWKGVQVAQDRPHDRIPLKMEHHEGIEATTRPEQAQLFAAVFREKITQITSECKIEPDIYNGGRVVEAEEQNIFTIELVSRIMDQTKTKSSYGFDNIPMRILKEGAIHLAKPYHKLMEMIYRTKTVPEQWKVARILPLHKKGAKSDFRNYRPISNLCAASKIFEKCILKRIETLAESGDLFTDKQHGFRKGRSTVTAARKLQTEIARAMDNDMYVAVASLDLSAAFDVVNIDLLIERLQIIGLPKDVILLLKAWLKDRKAYVEVEDACSEIFDNLLFGLKLVKNVQ